MAEALLTALKNKGVQDMKKIVVYDLNDGRLEFISKTFGCLVTQSIEDVTKDSEVILLAVKPQNVEEVAQEVKTPPQGTLLSIVAGYSIDSLAASFRTKQIVRSMPNTPAMVFEGVTVWTATKEVPNDALTKVRLLLDSIGEQVEVHDERYIDMATAVSGSGPAYIFLTMEAMVDAAVHLGFPRDIAMKLVLATIKGSAVYAQASSENVSNLRANVTSPSGTTASALYELDRGGFRTVVADAIWAAYRRALELGDKNPNVGPGRNQYRS